MLRAAVPSRAQSLPRVERLMTYSMFPFFHRIRQLQVQLPHATRRSRARERPVTAASTHVFAVLGATGKYAKYNGGYVTVKYMEDLARKAQCHGVLWPR